MYMDSQNRQFGAWRLDDQAQSSAVRFSIFIPDRSKDPQQYEAARDGVADFGDPKVQGICVAGGFQASLGQQNWTPDPANSMQRIPHPSGWVWTYTTAAALPAGFYEYKYIVSFENAEVRWVGDPCSRYGGQDVVNQNSGFVVGPSPVPTTTPLPGLRKALRDLVVYELNVDDFTDSYRYSDASLGHRAAFDAVGEKLDYLAQTLGITAILFMPWTAWANDLYSWGYTPYQYFSVEHRYTNDVTDTSPNHESNQLSRLRDLISACHARGMHVIMDGVFNHVGPDTNTSFLGFPYRWLYLDPDACPYTGTFGGTFKGLQDLDYHNGCTQQFIADVCFYWMDEFQIDGIRFDNAINFYVAGDNRGLPELLTAIKDHANDPNFSLTVEYLDLSAASVTNTTDATSYWNNALFENAFDCLWSGSLDAGLMNALDSHAGLQDGKVATLYLSNHDHSHVAWQAGAQANLGSMNWFRTQPYAIALFTAPGVPLLQNGQEFAEDHWIPEDDGGTGRRVDTRPLRWEFTDDPIGAATLSLYNKLIQIRDAHAGLRSDNFYPAGWPEWQTQFNSQGYGIDCSKQVVIYHRWGNNEAALERFMVVLNFSAVDQYVDVPFPANGIWTDLLNGQEENVDDFLLGGWLVSSNWGNVFYRQD